MSLRVVQDSTPETVSQSPDGTALRPLNVLTSGASSVPVAPVKSSALETSHQFATGTGKFLDATCWSASNGYFLIFDSASIPADGPVTPLMFVNINAGAMSSLGVAGANPVPFVAGLAGAFSSTGPFTKTTSGTAFLSARVIQP